VSRQAGSSGHYLPVCLGVHEAAGEYCHGAGDGGAAEEQVYGGEGLGEGIDLEGVPEDAIACIRTVKHQSS
jgi:hypothetical protein